MGHEPLDCLAKKKKKKSDKKNAVCFIKRCQPSRHNMSLKINTCDLRRTWQEGDDGCVRVGSLLEVADDLGGALPGVAANRGLVSDVAAAMHHHCDLAIVLLPRGHRLPELHLRH